MFGRNLFDQAKSILYTVQLFTEDSTAKKNPGTVQLALADTPVFKKMNIFLNELVGISFE